MQLFYVCLGVGVVYTVISFVLGQVFDLFDFSGDIELGSNISPLKPAVIATFVTAFGGLGIILMKKNFGFMYAFVLAFGISAFIAYIIYRYVIVKLYQAQNTSAVERQKLIGHKAKVTLAIRQGGYGKITYTINGNTYNSPAKAENGSQILVGQEVEIVYIDKNTYYVKNDEEGVKWIQQQ
jgi:membrane protein implicated in regulation of membrane protease activity